MIKVRLLREMDMTDEEAKEIDWQEKRFVEVKS